MQNGKELAERWEELTWAQDAQEGIWQPSIIKANKKFKCKQVSWVDDDETKIPVSFGISPYELWVRKDPMATKAAQSIAIALGCPSELTGKTFFAKDSIRLGFKTKRNETEMNWRFPSAC